MIDEYPDIECVHGNKKVDCKACVDYWKSQLLAEFDCREEHPNLLEE